MTAGTPTRGPAAKKGAEPDADTGNAAEAPVEVVGTGVRPSRPSNWIAMTRAQRKTWKRQGGKQHRYPGPCDLGEDSRLKRKRKNAPAKTDIIRPPA